MVAKVHNMNFKIILKFILLVVVVETGISFTFAAELSSVPLASCKEAWNYNQGIQTDINQDCYVDLNDFSLIGLQWLEQNAPEMASCLDTFDRANTAMNTSNLKNVWFVSDAGSRWEEFFSGNSGSGSQLYSPDCWLENNKVAFSRIGWGASATSYLRTSFGGYSAIQADMELVPWRDSGSYYQSNSYAGLLMYDSVTNAFAFLRIGPKISGTEHYFELNVTKSHDGEWNDWILQQPNNIGSAEYGSELGQATYSMEVYDAGWGDLHIRVSAEKNGTILASFDIDWYDDRPVFDQVQIYAKWDEWSKTSGAGAYIFADNVYATIPAETVILKGDLNKDDSVNFADFARLCQDWMRCNDPANELCEEVSPLVSPFAFGIPVPIFDVNGLQSSEKRLLFDNDTVTGINVTAGKSFTVKRASLDELVWLAVYIDASADGSFTVECNDVMQVDAFYKVNQGWYRHRLPYSNSQDVNITWNSSAKINEIVLLSRSPLPSKAEAGADNISVNVSMSGVGSSPMCAVPYGFDFVFDSHSVADATTVSATKAELIQDLHLLGVNGLRFPGGAVAYAYPPDLEALYSYASDVNVYRWNYHLIQQDYWGYTVAEDYIDFCKDANVIAWYQIDPGFYFDKVNNVVHQIYHMDSQSGNISGIPDNYSGNYVSQAVAAIAQFALLAKSKGVEVVWEIGNEDYSKYEPQTYAMLCKAFMDGIRAVEPTAKVAICADSYSWSDWSFPDQVVDSFNQLGVARIDYASNHLYLNGGTIYSNPDQMGDWIISRWGDLKSMFNSKLVSNFYLQSHPETKMAYTEFNALSNTAESQSLAMGAEIDHSVGRALADAYITPNVYQQGVAALFFHDMARNAPDSIYFARLDYYPLNPVGKRYHAYPEAVTTAIVAEHGNGQIAYGSIQNNNGIWVSRHGNYVYITVVNRASKYKNVSVALQGVTVNTGKGIERKLFCAASSWSSVFDYYYDEDVLSPPTSNAVILEVPSYSVIGLKVYIN